MVKLLNNPLKMAKPNENQWKYDKNLIENENTKKF